jgi:hemolysin-activating ACP:hemolysin acyltransferase
MTFEQADKLAQQIIAFMRQMGGPYTDLSEEYLQWTVLGALSTGQFVLRIDGKGIRYFACWWWLDDEQLGLVKPEDPTHRIRPQNIRSGPNVYVAEVASRGEPGDGTQLVRRIYKKVKPHMKNAYWHQAHRKHRLCTLKKEHK